MSTSLSAYDLCANYRAASGVASRAAMVRTWARVNVEAIQRLNVQKDRIAVIYQGVALDTLTEMAAVKKVPQRIVTAGRLIPAKGIEDAIAVFRRLAPRFPAATLTILGDGPQREALERLVCEWGLSERVRILGHVPQRRVFREMAEAEVFLFLSRHRAERLPNVVKEAMACGCVCIVSETPGIGELIQDRATGYIIAQGDLAAASEKIAEILSTADALSTVPSNAKQAVSERFDVAQIAAQLVERWTAALAFARAGSLPAAPAEPSPQNRP